MKRHALLAQELGMPERNILITEIGNCVELTEDTIKLGENFPAGTRLIDGEGFEDYGTSEVMKDRLRMSAEGIFMVTLAVTGNYVINDPIIESRGYVFAGNRDSDKEIKSVVQKAVEQYDYENGTKEELAATVKKALKNYIFKKTKQSPLIVPVIFEV